MTEQYFKIDENSGESSCTEYWYSSQSIFTAR